jgi:hypothetical protein
MKALLQTTFANQAVPGTSLLSIINHLLRHSLSDLLRSSHSAVINEIPAAFPMLADEKTIIPVVQELLIAVLRNSGKGRIHIRAEKFRDIIILEIEDRNTSNSYSLINSIKSLESMARAIGGNIHIKGTQQLETMITFSFPNRPADLSYNS